MNDWTFIFAHILIFAVFTVVGLLALLLPQENYSRMLGCLWPVSASNSNGKGIQRRMVGLILTIMGILALRGDMLSIYSPKHPGQSSVTPNPAFAGINPSWFPFVMGLLLLSAGFFVAFNPAPVVSWSQQRLFPERRIPEGTLQVWRLALRVMGALMVYSSSDLFQIWLKR